MSVTVNDIPYALRPMWVIDKRLRYHANKNRLLEGVNYDGEGRLDPYGSDGLPFVRPLSFTEAESVGMGAKGTFGPTIKVHNVFTWMVSAKREYGLFRRDPSAPITDSRHHGKGILEILQLVKDAIETRDDGSEATDWQLDGTIDKPLEFVVSDAPVSNLTWSAILQITIPMQAVCRGNRTATPEQDLPVSV